MADTDKPAPGAHLADPGPLGLGAFALTTFVLSCVNSGLFDKSVEPVVFGLALFYGGLVQVFAGMWEFTKGNTFGAVAFSSYGAFWMAFWYLTGHTDLSGLVKAGTVGQGVGLFLLAWTIFTAYMFIASTKTNGVLVAVFAVLTLTFLFLTIGNLGGSDGMVKLGGWLGILTALLAWYASFAGVYNGVSKKAAMPMFPRG